MEKKDSQASLTSFPWACTVAVLRACPSGDEAGDTGGGSPHTSSQLRRDKSDEAPFSESSSELPELELSGPVPGPGGPLACWGQGHCSPSNVANSARE